MSSLYGWLLARVQTGNYCFWIDSDVHVRLDAANAEDFDTRQRLGDQPSPLSRHR